MKALCQRFYDETARIEEMILLASVLADDSMPQNMEDFLEDDWETIEACLGKVPKRVKTDTEGGDKEAIQEWLINSGKYGFLVKMATPVMKPYEGGNGASYSWGYYTTKWMYGETLDAALEIGFAWVAEQRTKEKEKAGF